jgi:phenylpropionate dioxygenase-like ring-hydroxylating dioxygenase large terminal subunit
MYNGQAVAVIRTENQISAFEDYCPHRGLALSEGFVQNGTINCKYHGWNFNCQNGQNTFIPVKNENIKCSLKSFFVNEAYGIIWLSHLANAQLPTLKDGKHPMTMSGEIKANLTNTLENFLEGSHTHFVHDGLIRSKSKTRNEINAKIVSTEYGFQVNYEIEPAKGLVTKLLPKRFSQLRAVSTYLHPNIVVLEYFNSQDQMISRFEAILDEVESQIQYIARIFLNLGPLSPLIIPFAKIMFTKIIKQDKEILESQARNLMGFQNHKFISDETDIVGKYIHAWSNGIQENLAKEVHFKVYW